MNAEDQPAETPNPTKVKLRPEFSNLTRCSSCYNQQKQARRYYGDGESSSSAEDSGPEVDCESETESESGSSSCSERELVEVVEVPETEKPTQEEVCGDSAEPESGGKDVRTSPLLDPLNPHLMPERLLPRPHTVVSTLSLQVLSQDDKAFYVAKEQQKNTHKSSGEEFRINNPLPPQMGLLWQQPLPLQHQLTQQDQLQQHQLPHQDQLQQHQLTHQDQLQQHQLPHQDQLQQHQLPHQDQLQQHQLTHQDQLQQHQLPHQDQLQQHQLPHQDQLQQHQLPHQDQLQQHQLPHHLPQPQLSHQQNQQQHPHLLHLLQRQQLFHSRQLQQPQLFPPPGQMLPAPLHTLSGLQHGTFHAPLPVPNAPQPHLHTPPSQPCWDSDTMQNTYSPFGHYGSG